MSPIVFALAKKLLWSAGKNKLARRAVIAGAPLIWGFVKRRLKNKVRK